MDRHPIAQFAIEFVAITFGSFFLMTAAASVPASLYVLASEISFAIRSSG